MALLNAENALWVLSFTGQILLLWILFRRGRARRFPWFTLYIGYETALNVALIVIYRFATHKAYFWTYWGADILDALLQLGLVYEMARIGLRSRGSWVREARAPFFVYGGIGAAAAALMTFALDPKVGVGLQNWPFRLDQFSSLLVLELVGVLLWSANRLELRWGSWILGMCRGLAVWLVVSLGAAAAEVYWPSPRRFVLFNRLQISAYIVALVLWSLSFWREEPKREAMPKDVLDEVGRWRGGLGYDDVPKIGTDRKGS